MNGYYVASIVKNISQLWNNDNSTTHIALFNNIYNNTLLYIFLMKITRPFFFKQQAAEP